MRTLFIYNVCTRCRLQVEKRRRLFIFVYEAGACCRAGSVSTKKKYSLAVSEFCYICNFDLEIANIQRDR